MALNPTRLMAAIVKGEIAMPNRGTKSTMRLVLAAIVARADNDSGEIPEDFRVRIGDLAGDVEHKAAARALGPLAQDEYIIIERSDGRGERIGIRLGPKLMDDKQWPRRNDQAHRQNGKVKKDGRNDQAPRQNDRTKPRQNDQAQHCPNDQAPRQNDRTKPRQNDQGSPLPSTQVSTRSEGQLGEGNWGDGLRHHSPADSELKQESTLEPVPKMPDDPNVVADIVKCAIETYFDEGGPRGAGDGKKLAIVLRAASAAAIAKVPLARRAMIPNEIWEQTQHPKPRVAA